METVYQHFRPSERAFIDTATGWVTSAENQYSPYLTPFIDPRQAYILKTLVAQTPDFLLEEAEWAKQHERRRYLIRPDYYEVSEADFELSLLSIRYPSKFSTLTHPHILGALMNVGMKREVFGDILNIDQAWQIVVEKEVANYVILNLTKIGAINVQLSEVESSEALSVPNDYEDRFVTVSSMRLDTVIAGVYNISRQKVKTMIESGLVKVNWQQVENATFECSENDMLSVRKHGRILIIDQVGKSKKDKLKLNVKVK